MDIYSNTEVYFGELYNLQSQSLPYWVLKLADCLLLSFLSM